MTPSPTSDTFAHPLNFAPQTRKSSLSVQHYITKILFTHIGTISVHSYLNIDIVNCEPPHKNISIRIDRVSTLPTLISLSLNRCNYTDGSDSLQRQIFNIDKKTTFRHSESICRAKWNQKWVTCDQRRNELINIT